MTFKKLGIVAGIWLALLGYMILPNQLQLMSNSETVLLKTIPVDPRDLLRGDYVILRYVIADPDNIPASIEIPTDRATTLYVWLEKDSQGVASVKKVTKEEPPKGTLYVTGTIESSFKGVSSWWDNRRDIKFGIEKYFVPEGKGRPIENAMRSRNENEVLVEVSLSPKGNALIKNLRINGELVKF